MTNSTQASHDIIPYELFHTHYLKYLNQQIQESERTHYYICPEPATFWRQLSQQHPDKEGFRQAFEQYAKRHFQKVSVQSPQAGMWKNKTISGINLRPGLSMRSVKSRLPEPVKMGNEHVHGLIAGRTGSGKSVFMHNLILNLLHEYAPWEVALYLMDFKKVEFSRYAGEYAPPHVKACAATGEIRYVVSLIEHISHLMYERQTFFTKLGFVSIADFREKYPEIVLPRILLIIDEFQQMFIEANSKESDRIQDSLLRITKLGRSSGVHLLFASQEISNMIGNEALANFSIRFALKCTADVSNGIIGNNEAQHLKIGEVLLNSANGQEKDNVKYLVPFMNTQSKIFFEDILQFLKMTSEQSHFYRSMKYYQEDEQQAFETFQEIIQSIAPKLQSQLKKENSPYLEAITLGSSVLYQEKKFDYESLFLSKGINKNILICSTNYTDIAYMQKLFMAHFKIGLYKHRHLSLQSNFILQHYFDIEKEKKNGTPHERFYQLEDLTRTLKIEYHYRQLLTETIAKLKTDKLSEFLTTFYHMLDEQNKVKFVMMDFCDTVEDARDTLNACLQSTNDITKELDDKEQQRESVFARRARFTLSFNADDMEGPIDTYEHIELLHKVIDYYFIHRDTLHQAPLFELQIVWMTGIEAIEKIDNELISMMKYGTNYSFLFICSCYYAGEIDFDIMSVCDYYFASGQNQKMYDNLQMLYSYRSLESIVIDLKIKSLQIEKSFKRFKLNFDEFKEQVIDYDALL